MKYLDIPLSTTKLLKCVWQPLVDKVADKLPLWKGQLLQCTGRLTLIRTTLPAIPVFTTISLELPHWVIKVSSGVALMRSREGSAWLPGIKCSRRFAWEVLVSWISSGLAWLYASVGYGWTARNQTDHGLAYRPRRTRRPRPSSRLPSLASLAMAIRSVSGKILGSTGKLSRT
jgi:hypothetical protein